MIDLIRRNPRAFLFSLVVHVLVVGLTLFEFAGKTERKVVLQHGPQDQTIQAEVIDQKQLEQRDKKIEQQKRAEQQKREAEQKRKREQAEARKREEAKKKAEAEQKRKLAEEQRRKAEAEKQRKLEEQKRAAAEKKKRDAELKRQQAEEEARRKAEAEKKRIEEEKRRAEEERKRKEEEEARRKVEEERRKAEEARLAAEAEQRRKEAELKAQLAAEERQRELDEKRNRYYSLIREKISRNWRQPANAGNKPLCELNVVQGPGGVILDVTFGDCPGTREYRLSVEAAVLKSDPLPKPEDPELFERNINLIFKPND